jgi:uncharacterized protein with FMN-binding domain
MKNFKNYLPVIIISAVLLVIFVLGGMFSRYMTSQIDVHAEEQEIIEFNNSLIELVGAGEKVVEANYTDLEKEYLIPGFENQTYNPELTGSYKILNELDEEIAVVYIITTVGKFDGVEVAYAISLETDQLIDVLMIQNNETQSYFDTLRDDFYAQFVAKDLNDVVFTIDTVSGATYSSLSFDTGMKYARELYARDYGFEIPSIVYEITNVERNFDAATLVAKPYIVSITYDLDDKELVAYFDNEFNLVEVITGETPTETYLALFKNELPATTFIDVKTYITAFDETNKTVTIETLAYGGKAITVVFQLNATLDSVESMAITTTQTYDSDYNEGYAGGPNPAVENAYRDQYLADGTYIDAIGGATITSNAMIRIFDLVNDVLDNLNGGGN